MTLGAGTTILTASAEPKQQQQHLRLQLATLASNTNNTFGNESILLSLPTSTVNIRPNIQTGFNPIVTNPTISEFAYVDPLALIVGDCEIGRLVLVAPFTVCRADEGIPIHVGIYSKCKMV